MRYFFILLFCQVARGQAVVGEYADSVVVENARLRVVLHVGSGKVDYRMGEGLEMLNTVAYVEDLRGGGTMCSARMGVHAYSTERVRDSLGEGVRMNIRHFDEGRSKWLMQSVTLYDGGIVLHVEAGADIETRNISPLAVLPVWGGRVVVSGREPRILDEPFDNDEWVGVAERRWPSANGTGYEFCSVYDNEGKRGLVMGSLEHDVWKPVLRLGAIRWSSLGVWLQEIKMGRMIICCMGRLQV